MTWQDRTKEAAYVSPSGRRFTFAFTTADRTFDKNTTGYNFPGVRGTFVQDLGSTDRRYPMRLIFWGDDHDLEAAAFEAALRETGRGRLEHPRDGQVDVVPFGTVTIREDLVRNTNQTIYEVEFWESTSVLFPSGSSDPSLEVINALNILGDESAQVFADTIDSVDAIDNVTLRNRYQVALNTTRSILGEVTTFQNDVSREFNAIADSIQQGIDVFISEPLSLAFQTQILIKTPAKLLGNIKARLVAYSDLANDIIGGNNSDVVVQDTNNEFRTDELYAVSSVSGSILTAINAADVSGSTTNLTPSAGYKTRTEAIEAAESINLLFEAVNEWREANYAGLEQVDTGQVYQELQRSVAIATGFLVEFSFTLAQERRIVLGRPRSIIDLVAELYGSIDDQLDFFINTNDLSGDEIIELPAGRNVVYYT